MPTLVLAFGPLREAIVQPLARALGAPVHTLTDDPVDAWVQVVRAAHAGPLVVVCGDGTPDQREAPLPIVHAALTAGGGEIVVAWALEGSAAPLEALRSRLHASVDRWIAVAPALPPGVPLARADQIAAELGAPDAPAVRAAGRNRNGSLMPVPEIVREIEPPERDLDLSLTLDLADELNEFGRVRERIARSRAQHALLLSYFVSRESELGARMRRNVKTALAQAVIADDIANARFPIVPPDLVGELGAHNECEAIVLIAGAVAQRLDDGDAKLYVSDLRESFSSFASFDEGRAESRVFASSSSLDLKLKALLAVLKRAAAATA